MTARPMTMNAQTKTPSPLASKMMFGTGRPFVLQIAIPKSRFSRVRNIDAPLWSHHRTSSPLEPVGHYSNGLVTKLRPQTTE